MAIHFFARPDKANGQDLEIFFNNFDLIIGMDDMNLRHLRAIAPQSAKSKIHGIYDLVPGKAGQSIPDPWYTHEFQKTYDALHEALPYWLDYVEHHI